VGHGLLLSGAREVTGRREVWCVIRQTSTRALATPLGPGAGGYVCRSEAGPTSLRGIPRTARNGVLHDRAASHADQDRPNLRGCSHGV